MSLLFVLLFASAFSYAGMYESSQSQGVTTQLAMVSCSNPEVVTETTTVTFFGGPKLGWQKVPVEREKIVCGVIE
jgi:hypothetical protein